MDSEGAVRVPAAISAVKVADLKCNHHPNMGLFRKRPGKFYVKLFVNEDVQRTAVAARGNAASWDDTFYFNDLHAGSVLGIEVYRHHTIGSDEYIGGAKERIELLLAEGAGAAVPRKLRKCDEAGNMHDVQTDLEFTITSFGTYDEALQGQLNGAVSETKVVENMNPAPSRVIDAENVVDSIISTNNTIIPTTAAWDSLLDKIRRFTEIVDGMSEVHPYAKMAWSILSIAHKTIIAQKDRDDGINELAKTIGEAYAFVHLAEPLKNVESQKTIIISLTNQTVECSYFIRDYAKNKNFWKRTAKNLVSDVDSKVKQYQDTFNKIRLALQEHAVIHTEITVLRVLGVVGDLSGEVQLNDMPYAAGAGCDPKKGCLQGTREKVVGEICGWVNQDSDDTPRIFFLYDVAGAGKSAIAHEVARRFDRLKRLGSSYCFDRARQAERSPDNVFSTIARGLADLDPERKASLLKMVREQRELRTTFVPSVQFEKFILGPAQGLTAVGPTVIVIDALDESGDQESREGLLSVLGNEAAKLPSNLRLLITSRAEQDIQDTLLLKKHVLSRSIKDIDPNPADDIARFVKVQLGHLTALEHKWPNNGWCRLLVDKSEGHFQWASTACRFVKGDGKGGRDPVQQLQKLLVKNLRGLDQLYLGILKQIFGDDDDLTDDDDFQHRFQLVMGCMLMAREPLSISALQRLYNPNESGTEVHHIVGPMGALLRLPTQESDPITLLHTSFRDFLTDRNRSGPYYIDTSLHHDTLARSSLRVMMEELCFNICQLETSHLHNNDVIDLPARIKKHISSQLSYSCRFWADHVSVTTFIPDIGAEVKAFFETKLLYWLEVLSLLTMVPVASAALSSIVGWSQDNDTTAFVTDTRNFVAAFGSVISQSAPHLYLSALPFAPERSKLSQTYLPRFPRLLRIEIGKATRWLPIQSVLEGHTDCVTSVAFSQDGKRIISGSHDKTIRVWNADTGELILAPFQGHTGRVRSVAFLHDGKRIVSGSDDKTIRMWNADTGEVISVPFEGHIDCVTSVAFSHDGMRIVSGSYDRTIRVWNADTGELVSAPSKGHTCLVRSVALSQDGTRIVSGSEGNTICVWNADTGEVISAPFGGHTSFVTSVAFSQDGKRIVSRSDDETIRVWNADTGEPISAPFDGHTAGVTAVAFSHDGKRIVSGSDDNKIRVWNSYTGELISAPFEGHTGWIRSVAFSHDGKRIVSGSDDYTIRVWNADTGELISAPFEGQASGVASVAFSHDGQRIVSGSHDMTIRVWNADTGELISAPFEGHIDWVTSVAFSHDGKRIVSGSHDKTIRVWNAETGRDISAPFDGHTSGVTSVAFSHDGNLIVSGSHDKTIRLWNADTGELISAPFKGHTDCVRSVVFSHDDKRIVSGSHDKTIRVWNADTGELISAPFEGHTECVRSVAFSHDGKRIVSGSHDKTIRVWHADTGELTSTPFKSHTDWVTSVAFSQDGKRIVSGSDDKTIRVWNADTGELVSAPFEGHTDWVRSVAFSPDGKRIVSGSHDKTIRVWNPDTGEGISAPFDGHTSGVRSVAFSHDGKRIVSGSYDKTTRVWNADTGELVSAPFEGHTSGVASVAFSPGGQRIVSGSYDDTIRVWNVDTRALISVPFEGHTGGATSVAFSQDGNAVVAGSGDNTIRVCDAEAPIVDSGPFTGQAGTERAGFRNDSRLENGWLLNSPSELLFWIPPWSQGGLWRPANTGVIAKGSTKLDFSRFEHGRLWMRCRMAT